MLQQGAVWKLQQGAVWKLQQGAVWKLPWGAAAGRHPPHQLVLSSTLPASLGMRLWRSCSTGEAARVGQYAWDGADGGAVGGMRGRVSQAAA